MGFDGSEGAQRALDAASQLAGYGSTLTVLYVSSDGEVVGQDALGRARERLLERLVTATYVRRVGDEACELVALASELGADLVVVGRRGAEESSHPPGSVSADVVRRAACDVLVVG